MANNSNASEIVSFSRELMSFDLEDVSVEELDRRLELAIINLVPQLNAISCNVDCGTYCNGMYCTLNCGVDLACHAYHPPLQN